MYADETTVFLSGTRTAFTNKLLSQFKVVSGLEINISKTKAMQLGEWKNRADTPFNFNLARQAHLCFRCLLLL